MNVSRVCTTLKKILSVKAKQKMDPWTDRFSKDNQTETTTTAKICLNYPTCPKEERKLLNEIRAAGQNVPNNYKLSTGIRATDFSVCFLMRTHFKRKN